MKYKIFLSSILVIKSAQIKVGVELKKLTYFALLYQDCIGVFQSDLNHSGLATSASNLNTGQYSHLTSLYLRSAHFKPVTDNIDI